MSMDPHEDWSDQELSRRLQEWQVPAAPANLRARVFAAPARPWWIRIWTASIQIPVPVAACLLALLAWSAWKYFMAVTTAPPAPLVMVRTDRVEVPVIRERVVRQLVFRDRPVVASPLQTGELRAVTELRVRVIRREDGAKN